MDEAIHQLRVAAGNAASDFYRCQRAYIRSARDPVRRRSAEAMQALDKCLRAAQAVQGALDDLWIGLLVAAPFTGKEEEMRRAMALYEIMFSELHAIEALASGW